MDDRRELFGMVDVSKKKVLADADALFYVFSAQANSGTLTSALLRPHQLPDQWRAFGDTIEGCWCRRYRHGKHALTVESLSKRGLRAVRKEASLRQPPNVGPKVSMVIEHRTNDERAIGFEACVTMSWTLVITGMWKFLTIALRRAA
jgi:hypothetical protein